MKIKQSDTHNIISKSINLKQHKVVLGLVVLALYTGFIFLVGGIAYKDGFFGRVLRPVFEENIRIPFNYIRSLRAKAEHIIIDIKHDDFQKLAYKRELALGEGVLHSSSKDFVPAKIRWNGKTIEVNIRLKGDLADHWSDKRKWSFRVKTKGNQTILGMKEFSLQHPRTRGFLNDWYLHQLLRYIGDFIVLRYDFVKLTLNGKSLGVYLLEEHFDEMLLNNNKFIEAPIIRIYDHLLWYNVDPVIGFKRAHLYEHYTLSPIDAFNTGTVGQDETLLMNFNQAKNLLESFRQDKLLTHQVFEVEKLAKLFAVIDLLGYHHSTAYANIRFYYNPITSLLEPIGYDNTFIMEATSLQGQSRKLRILSSDRPQYIDYDEFKKWPNNFFSDKIFFRNYIEALDQISNKAFLVDFFEKTDKELQQKLDILYKTFPAYRFKYKPILYKNQEYIKRLLNPIQSLHAYFKKFEPGDNLLILELGNIQSLPIEVLHLSFKDYTFPKLQEEVILQPKTQFEFVDYQKVQFKLPEGISWTEKIKSNLTLKYEILGTNKIRAVSIFPWSHLDEKFLETDLIRRQPNYMDFPFVTVDNSAKTILIKPGNWKVDQDLIIPEGFMVIGRAGTRLDLSNSAKLLSYSPLKFMGTKDSPIIIQSENKTGQGIVVIAAGKKSIFQNVIFKNLSAPSQGDWQLSAAVTFYESPVVMYRCQFLENSSKDSLHIIRSEFTIDKAYFKNAHGNALRVTFGKGKISNSSFFDSGRDALYFSGSVIDGEKIFIKNSLGSGVSAEETSTININTIELHNTKIAIENTDMSIMNMDEVSIHHSDIGVAVFQKQPEFGPATVHITGLEKKNIKTDYLVEKKSALSIDGSYVNTSQENVQKLLYEKKPNDTL